MKKSPMILASSALLLAIAGCSSNADETSSEDSSSSASPNSSSLSSDQKSTVTQAFSDLSSSHACADGEAAVSTEISLSAFSPSTMVDEMFCMMEISDGSLDDESLESGDSEDTFTGKIVNMDNDVLGNVSGHVDEDQNGEASINVTYYETTNDGMDIVHEHQDEIDSWGWSPFRVEAADPESSSASATPSSSSSASASPSASSDKSGGLLSMEDSEGIIAAFRNLNDSMDTCNLGQVSVENKMTTGEFDSSPSNHPMYCLLEISDPYIHGENLTDNGSADTFKFNIAEFGEDDPIAIVTGSFAEDEMGQNKILIDSLDITSAGQAVINEHQNEIATWDSDPFAGA